MTTPTTFIPRRPSFPPKRSRLDRSDLYAWCEFADAKPKLAEQIERGQSDALADLIYNAGAMDDATIAKAVRAIRDKCEVEAIAMLERGM